MIESLSIFGENSKRALLGQFQQEGITFTREGFDIKRFCDAAEKLLGAASDFIFVKIIDEYCARSQISLEEGGLLGKSNYRRYSSILLSLDSETRGATNDK